MLKSDLKQRFIDTLMFNDNQYLDDYIELIVSNLCTLKSKLTERHHILPKNYYKRCGISDKSIINSETNLVYLSYIDHCKAHYYLYKCALDDMLKRDNLIALMFMLSEKSEFDIDKKIFTLTDEYTELKIKQREYIGSYTKGKKNSKITKWLLENHFDCSGSNNSRAVSVYLYDLNTRNLIETVGSQKELSQKLGVKNIKEKLNRSKYGLCIIDNYIITKTKSLDDESVELELNRLSKLKERKRVLRTFTCNCCGNTYSKMLSDADYNSKLSLGNFYCAECTRNGNMFRGKSFSEEHRQKISFSSFNRKWINNGVEQRQVKEPTLSQLLDDG